MADSRSTAEAARITLLVQGAPRATRADAAALAFARAAVAAGEVIHRVFFYKDAIYAASRYVQDEEGTAESWASLADEHGFELAVCVAAAQRRGVVEDESLADGFAVVGLGQMVEAMEASDRVVTFG